MLLVLVWFVFQNRAIHRSLENTRNCLAVDIIACRLANLFFFGWNYLTASTYIAVKLGFFLKMINDGRTVRIQIDISTVFNDTWL